MKESYQFIWGNFISGQFAEVVFQLEKFSGRISGLITYTVISSVSRDTISSSLLICIPMNTFCFLILLPCTSCTILNRYGEYTSLSPISVGLLQVYLHLIWYCLFLFSKLLLLCLCMDLEFLISPILLTWRVVVFCQMLFLHLWRWWCHFLLWVCLYNGLC